MLTFKNYVEWLVGWLVFDWSVVYIKKNILYAENFYYWQTDLEKMKEFFDCMVEKFWQAKRVTNTKCNFWETKNHMDFWLPVLKFWNTYKQYSNMHDLKNALL